MRLIARSSSCITFSLTICIVGAYAIGCSPSEPRAAVPKGSDVAIDGRHHFIPSAGMVPDSATAVRIAEAVLVPIYGQAVVDQQRPFKAMLADSVWIVNGTIPPNHVGGVAEVELLKRDGRVLRVSHGQ